MRRVTLRAGQWTVTAGRVQQPIGASLAMVVRMHLHGPNDAVHPFNAITFAPMPADLDWPPAWWGAFAEAAAHELETVIRDGRLSWLPIDELPIVRVSYPADDAEGIELLDGEAEKVVHVFTLDDAHVR